MAAPKQLGRYIWDRAADDVGWPRTDHGTWRWTFHSLRHVFANDVWLGRPL